MPVEYPVFFWTLTAAYAGVASRGIGWRTEQTVANRLALGPLLHFNTQYDLNARGILDGLECSPIR